ncbi:MAG: hypothetical protein ACXW1E_07350 [Halobacteriota archaeon]
MQKFAKAIKKFAFRAYIQAEFLFKKKRFQDYPLAWHSDDRAWFKFFDYKTIFTTNEAIVSFRVSSESISGKEGNLTLKKKQKDCFLKI